MRLTLLAGLLLLLSPIVRADDVTPLAKGVRGLMTQAKAPIAIDGDLNEWDLAYCTPVHYEHGDPANRAGQFFYAWDDKALYVGLRVLDVHQGNVGTPGSLWNGDAVEFYLDTRSGSDLRAKDWTPGAVHLFFTPFEGTEVKPRWEVRGGIATSDVKLEGVQIAAKSHDWGYECEFALPWKNFPDFKPKMGSLLALDCELCYGDGGARTDRTFSYGSPLSVQQPASLGLVELVELFDPSYLAQAGPASFPMWVETPWVQPERGEVRAVVAIPPAFADVAGAVTVRLHDADGKILKEVPAPIENFGPKGLGFLRAVASWSIDEPAPNTYFATARIDSRTGKILVRVTPRMIQEGQTSGR
jgi:hypothetical protein